MTDGLLTHITPDSFSGIIFALEGVGGAVTLLNGPTGCKFYHSAMSDYQSIRQLAFDPLSYPAQWYFGQPRVPCTYLDSRDYVYGSGDKLEEACTFLRENVPFDLLGVVNSPGAALIGDDLRRVIGCCLPDKPVVVIESPGFSSTICDGYDIAAREVLRQLGLTDMGNRLSGTGSRLPDAHSRRAGKRRPAAVNILGMSIFHRHNTGDMQELRRLLGLCGVDVNCFVCADCSIETLAAVPEAALNIVVYPEYADRTAQFLRERYGTPFYVCDGPPVGFDATEKMMGDICSLLGCDASAFAAESEKARARAYTHISRVHSMTGLPKGVRFSLEGTCSELYAYAGFLVRYFGMVLESANVLHGESGAYRENLERLLTGLGLSGALQGNILEADSELVFASGGTIAQLKLLGKRFSGIETSLPSLGYIDVLPKASLGLTGALAITEQVLNGLIFG